MGISGLFFIDSCDDVAEGNNQDHCMTQFHRNIKFLMRRQGETQASLAEEVDVSQPTVSNWLQGTIPGNKQLNSIAVFFGVTTDELINHELPHKENIQALTELERELKTLKAQWDGVVKKMKQVAKSQAEQAEYPAAAENHLMATGMESCLSDLAKVISVYFPDNVPNTEGDRDPMHLA